MVYWFVDQRSGGMKLLCYLFEEKREIQLKVVRCEKIQENVKHFFFSITLQLPMNLLKWTQNFSRSAWLFSFPFASISFKQLCYKFKYISLRLHTQSRTSKKFFLRQLAHFQRQGTSQFCWTHKQIFMFLEQQVRVNHFRVLLNVIVMVLNTITFFVLATMQMIEAARKHLYSNVRCKVNPELEFLAQQFLSFQLKS